MTPEIQIRPYNPGDMEAILLMFDLNTPPYFAPEERDGLLHYLGHEIEYYFVATINGIVVGCGGINLSDINKTGVLSWDIVHPDFQGNSVGKSLVDHRIQKLKQFREVEKIVVRTSQLSYKFYEKMGFRLLETEKDYWAEGFDLYSMVYAK